jgi:hypothetical protein
MRLLTGFSWLRIGSGGGVFWTWTLNFGFYKTQNVLTIWATLSSQEGLNPWIRESCVQDVYRSKANTGCKKDKQVIRPVHSHMTAGALTSAHMSSVGLNSQWYGGMRSCTWGEPRSEVLPGSRPIGRQCLSTSASYTFWAEHSVPWSKLSDDGYSTAVESAGKSTERISVHEPADSGSLSKRQSMVQDQCHVHFIWSDLLHGPPTAALGTERVMWPHHATTNESTPRTYVVLNPCFGISRYLAEPPPWVI